LCSYSRTSQYFIEHEGYGRAVAQTVSRWFPTAAARVLVRADMWGLWCTKRHWSRFSPSNSVSLANHHSTNLSIIIITLGWHNRFIGGRSAEWTQLDSTPHYTNIKNLEPEGSLPCSQYPSTAPYPEPNRSSPYLPILSL
jgi:hypothetical protein